MVPPIKLLGRRPVRTVGCEPELTSLRDRVEAKRRKRDWADILARLHSLDSAADELGASRFQELFSLFGRDEDGAWVRDLIPARIVASPAFAAARKAIGVDHFHTSTKGTFYTGWGKLDGDALFMVLPELLGARGQYADDLQLRKDPPAWKDGSDPRDAFIPETVAEEWRAGHFSNLEFPMVGGTRVAADLADYQEHLYRRLGMASDSVEGTAEEARALPAHVHWLPHLDPLPPAERHALYDALIQFWGAGNDRTLLESLAPADLAADEGGRLTFSRKLAIKHANGPDYEQYSILPLTLETYRRLEATPDGIRVANRHADLDPHVDGNFPPCFKRLAIGIRGKLGAPVEAEDAPISTVHLEGRVGNSIQGALDLLPTADPVTGEVDVDALLSHRDKGPFGLVSDPRTLAEGAAPHGLDAAFIDDLCVLLSRGEDDRRPVQTHGWPKNVYLASVLLPLTPWLERPLIRAALAELDPDARRTFESRYQSAVEAWVIRMRDVARARREPEFEYQPDWSESLPYFPDGVNRIFSRDVSHLNFLDPGPNYFYNTDPDHLFTTITRSEAVRFVVESGLGELLRNAQRT